jgi:hypothetical protein
LVIQRRSRSALIGTRSRASACLILALGIVAALAACGGDDEPPKPKTLAIELSQSGKNFRFSVPESVEGGLVRIQFTNSARGEHGAQLGRIQGQHTLDEALKAGDNWGGRGRALPSWLRLAGGVGTTPAGATRSANQFLPAGNYFVVDVDSNAGASFQITGDGGEEELPSAAATIKAAEYAFSAQGLKAGKNRILFDNVGREPHLLFAAPMKAGATIADVRRFVEEEKGEPPIEDADLSTSILEGRTKQVVDADLRKGRYAMICFIPDRKGGPPHSAKGMVSEAVVR